MISIAQILGVDVEVVQENFSSMKGIGVQLRQPVPLNVENGVTTIFDDFWLARRQVLLNESNCGNEWRSSFTHYSIDHTPDAPGAPKGP